MQSIYQNIGPLSISQFISPCVCPCVCPSVHFLWYRLNIFFPPLAKVGCPTFLGIRNPWVKQLKEMVSDLKTFTNKGCKIARQFFFLFQAEFCFIEQDFFYLCFSLRLTVFLPPLPKVQCPKFLDFWNHWGKLMERSGLK